MFLPLSFCLWLHHNFLPIPHNTTPFPPSSNSLNFLPQIFMFFNNSHVWNQYMYYGHMFPCESVGSVIFLFLLEYNLVMGTLFLTQDLTPIAIAGAILHALPRTRTTII